jgi:hypothetical protein
MELIPTLSEPSDVMAKLAREHCRAINGRELTDIADHLYNFCITSLSIRDHLLEHLKIIIKDEKKKKIQYWGLTNTIKAAHEIGNSSKHFCLRDPRTLNIRTTIAKNIETSPLKIKCIRGSSENRRITWADSFEVVIVFDNKSIQLWPFMSEVREFWEGVFGKEAILYKKLPHREYLPLFTSEIWGHDT